MYPLGPYADRSNRVVRSFPGYERQFLRVSFADEVGMKIQYDNEIDNKELVEERVRGILRDGLSIAGRQFQFLAYTMSGLRDHSVWFLEPFRYKQKFIDAESIRTELGDFTGLIQYPSLYGARLSQAFS